MTWTCPDLSLDSYCNNEGYYSNSKDSEGAAYRCPELVVPIRIDKLLGAAWKGTATDVSTRTRVSFRDLRL